MKIFYVGNYKQRHCTEVHIAATLEDLGHTVIRHQESDFKPGTLAELAQGSDMVLWTRTMPSPVTNADIEALRASNITSVSYHLDLYVGIQREAAMDADPFWRTDYVFTPDGDPRSAEVFKAKGINHFYVPPGVYGPECYFAEASPGVPFDKEYDVIFVGGGVGYHAADWPYRTQLMGWLKKTYGDRFKKFGHPEQAVRNEELNELYAKTKVVVGDSLCKGFDHEYYWSDRIPETTGRGGFLIHPYIKGLEENYVLNRADAELVTYNYGKWDDLKTLIDYYLEHDEERETIRARAMERTKNNHTYHQRLAYMLQVVHGRGVGNSK